MVSKQAKIQTVDKVNEKSMHIVNVVILAHIVI